MIVHTLILCVKYALLDYRDRSQRLPSKRDYSQGEGFFGSKLSVETLGSILVPVSYKTSSLVVVAVPPTHTDSSVFIRILRGIYGHTDTTRHYTEARFRPQAMDMLLGELMAVTLIVSVLA